MTKDQRAEAIHHINAILRGWTWGIIPGQRKNGEEKKKTRKKLLMFFRMVTLTRGKRDALISPIHEYNNAIYNIFIHSLYVKEYRTCRASFVLQPPSIKIAYRGTRESKEKGRYLFCPPCAIMLPTRVFFCFHILYTGSALGSKILFNYSFWWRNQSPTGQRE